MKKDLIIASDLREGPESCDNEEDVPSPVSRPPGEHEGGAEERLSGGHGTAELPLAVRSK